MTAESTSATLTPRGTGRAVRPQAALHVIADLSADHGGNVRAVADLCEALSQCGIRCEIASLLQAPKGGTSHAYAVAASTLWFRPSPPQRIGNSLEFARWLSSHVRQYDLIEIHEIFRATSVIAAVIAHRNAVPYLVHPHGSLDPFDLRKHRFAKRALAPLFRQLLLKHARGIVFTSSREEREADTLSSRAPRYHVAPVVLDNIERGERAGFRESLGISDDTFLLLFMSRIDYKKGLFRTLSAVRAAARTSHRLELVIAGSGEARFEQRVRAEVTRLRIDDVVHFVGFLEGQQKADAMAAADALILVSDNENFGIIVVEALRAGLPVIISDRVAIADELAGTGAAKVVPLEDAATVAALLEAVALGADARRHWSCVAARVGGRLYDSDSVVRAQIALRQRVIGSRGTQPRDQASVSDRRPGEVEP